MELLAHYEVILHQGIEELGPVKRPASAEKALEADAMAAPELGDILYRLCIEHGTAYTPFRETVIKIISDPAPVAKASKNAGTRVRPFADSMHADHALIILALEMMPPDMPF
ncbi:MAG: hypothetical protein EXS14_06945 [Planctomycetes bacterium]|nr:hypothetical protein [Planctomycetota bacterium]